MNPNPVDGQRTYLIVGASGMIGAAEALQLAGRKCILGLHYRHHRNMIESIGQDLSKRGCSWEAFPADM